MPPLPPTMAPDDSLTQQLRQRLLAMGQFFGNTLLAQSCILCSLPSGETPLCQDCAAALPALKRPACPRCALPFDLSAHGTQSLCPDCMHHTPTFDSATAVWSYGFPVDTLIRDFKYGHHLYLSGFFGTHLAHALADAWENNPNLPLPDLVLPMPLHPNRLKARGFNQAAEIGRQVAKILHLRWSVDHLLRQNDTPPQAGLHRTERWSNLRGAFFCPQPLQGQRILLIDDVLTTGASLSACADILRFAGASRVDVAVLARTPEPGQR